MTRTAEVNDNLRIPRTSLLLGCLVLLTMYAMAPVFPSAHAQAGVVTASPGDINLGMTTSIALTAPAPGTYNVTVEAPNGAKSSLGFTFTAAGQTKTQVFGNASIGWGQVVNQAGTYNVQVYQGSTVVGGTSFYTTNVINISTDFISAGACLFIASGSRGQELLFQILATYASNNAPIAPSTAAVTANGDEVTYTLPDGTTASASLHAPDPTTWPVPWFQGHVWGTWNTSWVGTYAPAVTVSDRWGNKGALNTAVNGYPFIYSPATLQQSIALTDPSGKTVAALSNNQNVTITANVAYLVTPTSISAVAGFNGPLDSATRGGVVSALVGWGVYNTTTNTFANAKGQPGGVIATVPLTYSSSTKTWRGTFNTGTLPALVNATTYSIALSSHDKATPPNTGSDIFSVPPVGAISNLPGAASTSKTSVSTVSSTSAFTTTVSQVVQSIPGIVYVAMVVLLVAGLIIGLLLNGRMPGLERAKGNAQ